MQSDWSVQQNKKQPSTHIDDLTELLIIQSFYCTVFCSFTARQSLQGYYFYALNKAAKKKNYMI